VPPVPVEAVEAMDCSNMLLGLAFSGAVVFAGAGYIKFIIPVVLSGYFPKFSVADFLNKSVPVALGAVAGVCPPNNEGGFPSPAGFGPPNKLLVGLAEAGNKEFP